MIFYLLVDTDVTRLGKELEILQSDNPRDGRLDIVVLTNNEILILESKTSLITMVREGRYKEQIQPYYDESRRIIENYILRRNESYNLSIYLFIGGDETCLFPSDHPDCISGLVGNTTEIFYDSLLEFNIKFISANALWALSAYSQIINKKIYWYDVFPKYFKDPYTLGFVSGGRVILDRNKPVVINLDLNI